MLFIKGTPKSTEDSFSLKLAEQFLSTYKEKNPGSTVEMLDLYSEEIPLIDADVLSAWGKFQTGKAGELTPTETQKITRLNVLQDQFLRAQYIVLAAPVWNFGYPPLVKAYIDAAVVVTGKTFSFGEGGSVGLLKGKGKKFIVLEAAGGIYTGTPMEQFAVWRQHLKGVLGFIGIDDVTFVAVEGVNADPASAQKILNETIEKAQSVAQSL